MANPPRFKTEHQNRIVEIFRKLHSGRHNYWTVWYDFVTMAACSLSYADVARREERERLYAETSKKYTESELNMFAEMFSEVILGFEENPDQDLLGEIFMRLELGSGHKGQFFTPYNVCKAMASISAGDLKAEIDKRGYISVNDPCCGAGALLIAFANEAKRQGINYQQCIEFVAQDIDFTVAMMCYIQLSLLGCAGYVIVGNSLLPPDPEEKQNIWYTPLYFLKTWHWRRTFKALSQVTEKAEAQKQADKPEQKEPEKKYPFKVCANGQLSLF